MDAELLKAPQVKVDVSHTVKVQVPRHTEVEVIHTVSPELADIILAAIVAATLLSACVLWRWKRG